MRLKAVVLSTLIATVALSAKADIVSCLDAFNHAPNNAECTRLANSFFRQLYDEEFIDTLLIYKADMPADTLREQVWYWSGEYFYAEQQYDKALEYATKALPLFHLGNDRIGEADCTSLLAITNIRLGSYEEAIYYARQCYDIDRSLGDAERVATSLNSLAAIYLSANRLVEAERYVLEGIDVAEVHHLPERKALLLGMASEVYHAKGNDVKALSYAEQAYDMEVQLGREFKAMVRRSQKASALVGLHRYFEAEQELLVAIPYFRQVGDRQSLGISCNKMGLALIGQQRMAQATPYFREAAAIFMELGDRRNEMHARKGLYESLWVSAPDSAKMELERFNLLKDSLYNSASAESLSRYQAQYDAEFGNDWLRQENLTERQAKRRAIMLGGAIAALLLFFSVIVWWVMRRRNQRQASINHQLSANIEELRERYRELSVHYDNALATGSDGGNGASDELNTADRTFLEKTVEAINEHIISGHVDADSVAASMNMSLFQFRQRLSAVAGETPQNFIAMIRMRRARYLLDNRPELNINEVAQLCAYNDTPNFSRAFKKTFGLTPTQYLEKKQ